MRLGVRLHDLGRSTPEEMADRTRGLGFEYVQLVLHKALEGENGEPVSISKSKAREISGIFMDYDIGIALLGSYFNPVHSDIENVQRSVYRFKEHLRHARAFNTRYVGTETGSYNDDEWTYNPRNLSEEAFYRTKVVFSELQRTAMQHGSYVAVEGSYGHVISNPDRLKRFYDEVNEGHIKIILDLFNFLNTENHQNHLEIFHECIDLFGDNIVIFHLKDYQVQNQTLVPVGLGKGMINYSQIIPTIEKYFPDSYCIFEEVPSAEMESSIKYIQQFSKQH